MISVSPSFLQCFLEGRLGLLVAFSESFIYSTESPNDGLQKQDPPLNNLKINVG